MAWDYEKIDREAMTRVKDCYAAASRDELVARIAELEAGYYPIFSTFSPILRGLSEGETASFHSKMFPLTDDDDRLLRFDPATSKSVVVDEPVSDLSAVDYYTEDGMQIESDTFISDAFELISCSGSFSFAGIYHGSITAGDLRRAFDRYWAPYRKAKAA